MRRIALASIITLLVAPVLVSADNLSELEAQLAMYKKQMTLIQGRIDQLQAKIDTLKGSTTGEAPVCELKAAKDSYVYGESIVLTWTSKGATYAGFVLPGGFGGVYLKVPGDKLPAQGSQSITASITGSPEIALAVYAANGKKAICKTSVRIGANPVSATTTPVRPPVLPPQASTTVATTSAANAAPAVITVATDASSPGISTVTAGATGVVLAAFRINATVDSFTLEKLALKLGSGKASDITGVTIFSSTGTLLGSATFVGTALVATSTLNSPLKIPRDTSATIFVKVDFAGVGVSQPGTPGTLVRIDAAGIEGTSITSGTIVRSQAAATTLGARLFRSVPTIAIDQLSTTGVIDGRLMHFKITAAPAGQVNIGKLTFSVSPSGATVTRLRLFGFTDASYTQAIPGVGVARQVGTTTTNAGGGAVTAMFDAGSKPVMIPAGSTYYFELRADVTKSTAQGAVATTLLGDASPAALGTLGAHATQHFVWSGNSIGTALGSDPDWSNGYAIAGLPAVGISQSRVAVADALTNLASAFAAFEQTLDSMTAFYLGR